MKYSTATILLAYFGLTSAVPYQKREVPQEHSHQAVLDQVAVSLKLDNPDKIQDSVFGLLGDTAAAKGAGNIKNLDCLQRAIADQAFTNEKKAGNVDGMANALIFAALEKNTGAVGKASNTCTDKAVNPEIDAISQHQDPAGEGAAAANKKTVLDLAVQLESIGADPQLAATSATFAPGKLGDTTGAGNTCDDLDDKKGCIFTKKLIQVEATPEEIDAAVKGGGAKGAKAGASATKDKASDKGKASGKDDKTDGASEAEAADATDAKASGKGEKASDKGKASGKDAKTESNAADAESAEVCEKKASGKSAKDEKASGKGDKAEGNADAAKTADASDAADAKASGKGDKASDKGKASGKDAKADGDAGAAEAEAADATDAKASGKGDKASDKGKASGKDAKADGDAGAAEAEAVDAGAGGDLGSCGTPTVEFGVGLGGRQEPAFQATNQKDFNHGAALNIKVISDFICQRLQDSCKASADTVENCNKASLAAQKEKGQKSADVFNAGVTGKA
ncbi:BgTH12-04680 [Blumeria graminis f. sp. triticale]|uniref:BgTH12-04680 n=1 Tax=Blumeria graminis f. sp. triticale TaxID=1689686 RepID=A0A9W4GBW0_BLUGR|nr:BgTH12-04680 [Blumeria graminis f. sp. triticale]